MKNDSINSGIEQVIKGIIDGIDLNKKVIHPNIILTEIVFGLSKIRNGAKIYSSKLNDEISYEIDTLIGKPEGFTKSVRNLRNGIVHILENRWAKEVYLFNHLEESSKIYYEFILQLIMEVFKYVE